MRLSIVFYVYLVIICNTFAAHSNVIYPNEVINFLEKHQCIQENDWYLKQIAEGAAKEEILPPFVYDNNKKGKKTSLFFICKKSNKLYKIIFINLDNTNRDCPDSVYESSSEINGLKIVKPSKNKISGFWRRDKNNKVITMKPIIQNNILLQSEYETTLEFYCHNGQWWQKVLD
ncbi:MAG: hypothetical protein HQK52_22700 [Oligoflexia bacterium]|nr:hypothetical protein [Oligoflexia bacterium]